MSKTKIGFRFSFIFILSFILVMNNGAFPLFHYINRPIVQLMHEFTPWFAKNVLNYSYDYSIFTNGSGDTSYDWITLLILFLWAIIGAIIWSIADRKRKNYSACYYWLTTFMRYYIAFMLINYGMIKLVHAQMPPPGLDRLMQPLGEFSPMGLAWTYFGYSKGYNIFVGIVEILAGLLLFRKIVVLGALITMAVSINIMTTNYFFDVPVKMVSTALLILSIFLLLPHLKPLFNFLILGKSVQIKTIRNPKFTKAWKNKILIVIKITVIGIFVIQQISGLLNRQKLIDHYFKKSPLYGIYLIESSNEIRTTIPEDWTSIVFEYEGHANIRDMYYKKQRLSPVIDPKEKKISLNNYTFDYSVLENGDILLTKTFSDRTEEVKLIKQHPEEFELIKRKFNWIQEHPYNR
ncbi:DoxX family protein [Sphingobacterium phlebotomi]|uniref:DoxX family protein n=1 Tax=Sphingobacterium phlebotomi TaxID=2605433 RepID=A0A5D4GTK9_9SPHI|nr:DoxX family protein [Sphingobacterium phlebotomi]TYR32211.1 DoxX family protein [Sphingobacterium phlebotomi]